MPNWCYNDATLFHEDSEKVTALVEHLKEVIKPENKDSEGFFNYLRPRPESEEENWYGWNVENWGTKWDATPQTIEKVDENSAFVVFDTAWGPPIDLYDYLQDNGWVVSASYEEPGMAFIGEYEDGENFSYDYDFSDDNWEDDIPEDLIEHFNLREAYEDYCEWRTEDESEDD